MARLYIANVSLQRQIVTYRLDVDRNGDKADYMRRQAPRQEIIPPKLQVPVGGDYHKDQIAAIIEQLEPYGIIAAEDVPNKLYGVHQLVYGVDVATPTKVLDQVRDHNNGFKLYEGTVRRQRAAIAANQAMTAQIGEVPPVFDVEFEQETVSDLDEKAIAEGFHVVKDLKDTDRGPKVLSRKRG